MKAKILFIIAQSQGHINASMFLAQTLYDRGNEIIYANDIQYKANLISAGFHFLELSNIIFGFGDEEYLHKQNQSKDFYLDVLVDRMMFAAYKHRAESLKKFD